jgi:hypothetical protein
MDKETIKLACSFTTRSLSRVRVRSTKVARTEIIPSAGTVKSIERHGVSWDDVNEADEVAEFGRLSWHDGGSSSGV